MDHLKELALVVHEARPTQVVPIWDKGDLNPLSVHYNKLLSEDESELTTAVKRSLQRELVDSVFHLDLNASHLTKRQKAYYQCYKDWAAVKILLARNARNAAIELSHKIWKLASAYEFTEILIDTSRTLRLHYGTRMGDRKKYKEYNDAFKDAERVWQAENHAEELYTDLTLHFVNSKSAKSEVANTAKDYLLELRPFLERYSSYRLQLCAMLIEFACYTSEFRYVETAEVCHRYIRLFDSKSYEAQVPLQICYYQLMICHTQLKQFEEGQAVAQKCLELYETGSFNWFKLQELRFTLAMHTDNYADAAEIWVETTKQRKFKFLPGTISEQWQVFNAYLHFLEAVGKVELPKSAGKFRFAKFLNDLPQYSQDKRGRNIPVLILQVLFLVKNKRYGDAIDRIEAVKKYCSRYLQKDETFRSNCFIRLLLLIPENSFHKTAVVRKADKWLEKLEQVPFEVSNQAHEVEIIQYEKLWQYALELLDEQFHTRKSKNK